MNLPAKDIPLSKDIVTKTTRPMQPFERLIAFSARALVHRHNNGEPLVACFGGRGHR